MTNIITRRLRALFITVFTGGITLQIGARADQPFASVLDANHWEARGQFRLGTGLQEPQPASTVAMTSLSGTLGWDKSRFTGFGDVSVPLAGGSVGDDIYVYGGVELGLSLDQRLVNASSLWMEDVELMIGTEQDSQGLFAYTPGLSFEWGNWLTRDSTLRLNLLMRDRPSYDNITYQVSAISRVWLDQLSKFAWESQIDHIGSEGRLLQNTRIRTGLVARIRNGVWGTINFRYWDNVLGTPEDEVAVLAGLTLWGGTYR